MDIDNLLDKLSSEEKEFLDRHIFAPYVRGSTSIHVKISGVVYKLKTAKKRKDGFGVFKATDASNARMIRQAEQHEIDEYLNLFPSVEMILVYNLGRWLAYPANANDFKHRFKSEPALCNVLMVDNANMLDIVVARFDGANFWFDSVKFGTSSEHLSTLRERIEKQNYTLTKELQVGLSPEEEAAFKYTRQFHREATMSDLEKRLNKEFTQVDANVDGFTERGTPTSISFIGKLYGEAEALAVAKVYQDSTDFHLKHPVL